jgi:hypothetical protein
MRTSGLISAAVFVLALAPAAPARAFDISPGDLMYTDFFKWSNWREILQKFDCTEEMNFYLWNAPSPAPHIVIPPATPGGAVMPPPTPLGAPEGDLGSPSPTGAPGGDDGGWDGNGGGMPTPPTNPIQPPGGGGGVPAVPEPSTWAMVLIGFAGLGYAGFLRRGRASGGSRRLQAPA